jgi:sulfopyruvate decarboxylase subunit alpha
MSYKWPDPSGVHPASVDVPDAIRGQDIIDAIEASGTEFVVSVPDITTAEALLRPLATHPRLRLVRVCKEDEGIGICAGLAACGKRAVLLIQNTGFFDSINAIRAVAVEYRQPICMMIGLLGKEPDVEPRESGNFGVAIVEPMLDVLGIRHQLLDRERDAALIAPAIAAAYAESRPLALLIGRPPRRQP